MKQREIKKYVLEIIKWILFFVPFVLGTWGMMKLGEGTFFDCCYKAIQLYIMDYNIDSASINWMCEVARWTAPLATATAIVLLVNTLIETINIWIKLKKKDAVAIHGNDANIDIVMSMLGKKAVRSEKRVIWNARRHILMFEDDLEMYDFLDENGIQILHNSDKEIFLCSEKILRGSYENRQIIVCNVAENCARNYWFKYPVLNEKEKILIVGFENYGQRLLTQALLKNVISIHSRIEYHITGGDYREYLSKHYKLSKVAHIKRGLKNGKIKEINFYNDICDNHDSVIFYDIPWYDIMRKQDFDRIILICDIDAQNIDILNEMKTYYPNITCHIKFADNKILEALWNTKQENIVSFGVKEELYSPEMMLKEKLFIHSKMIHARYYANHVCDGKCEGKLCTNKERINGEYHINSLEKCMECPKLNKDWCGLNTFLRYSNVATADHIPEKVRLILKKSPEQKIPELEERMEQVLDVFKEKNLRATKRQSLGKEIIEIYQNLSEEDKKELWRVEHIRWNRYHFMNNWDYYTPEKEGERKNVKMRKHSLLLRFTQLPKEQQKKDEDTYLALEELLVD